MHSDKMKRKVAKVGRLRLSPNEEALLVKEEVERRRKLRLQQVREQERLIASQIREDVRQRRDQQLHHLAEELKAEWRKAQDEKVKTLEKLYLSSLKAVGEGHQRAKENLPDLNAIEKQVAVFNQRAENRHRAALKELKHRRESQLTEQSRHIQARKQALHVERERAAKIASLPAPPPEPFEMIQEVRKVPAVKISDVDSFSVTHYHLVEPYVDRETDTEQPDARLAAVEEGKRLEELHEEDERERREQLEKAMLRGHHALKMVHLSQDRDRLLKELEQMQYEDLSRRRQTVAQMPQQLFEPAYRRIEMKEDWQREMEFAFEDMYTGDRRVKGDLVLELEPEPLPAPSVGTEDEELDLSVDPGHVGQAAPSIDQESETVNPPSQLKDGSHKPQSKLVLHKLLHRIRNQKVQRASSSDMTSVAETVETGSLPSEEGQDAVSIAEQVGQQELHREPEPIKPPEIVDSTVVAGNSILLHPYEQASRVRMAAERSRQMELLEQQKQQQLALLQQLEDQRLKLEENFQKAQLKMQESSTRELKTQAEHGLQAEMNVDISPAENVNQTNNEDTGVPETANFSDNQHLEIIHNYQQRLLQQNKLHKQSVEEARKHLHDYQDMLKKRYPSLATSSVDPTVAQLLKKSSENIGHSKHVLLKKNAIVLQSGSESITHLGIPEVSPSRSTEQYLTPQYTVQQPQQWFTSSQPMEMFGALGIQPQLETYQSFTTHGDLGTAILSAPIIPNELQSQPSVQKEKLHVSQDYVAVSPRQVVQFWTNPDVPNPLAAQPYSEELFQQLPEAQRFQVVPNESDGALHYRESHRSKDIRIEQPSAPPVLVHPHPSSMYYGKSTAKGAAHHQLTHTTGDLPLSSAVELRQKLLTSSMEIQAQQDQLKELQLQLDQQREALLSKQKLQEQSLLQKRNDLKSQLEMQQAALSEFLRNKQIPHSIGPPEVQTNEQLNIISSLLNTLRINYQEDLQDGRQRLLGKEHKLRPLKPPVTKTKLGPILEQHELSAIQEMESPRSGRPSYTGRPDLPSSKSSPSFMSLVCDPDYTGGNSDTSYCDTDLSRVSASTKNQSSGTSSSGSSRLSWRQMLTLETVMSHSAGNSQVSEQIQPVPSNARNVEGAMQLNSDSRPNEKIFSMAWPTNSFNVRALSAEPLGENSCSTTISSGTILNSDKADSSSGNDECSPYSTDHYNSSFARGSTNSLASLPVSLPLHPPRIIESSTAMQELQQPAEKHRSHIQQIIDKYTKNLNGSFDSSIILPGPALGLDFSNHSSESSISSTFHLLELKTDDESSTLSIQESERPAQSQDTDNVKKSNLLTDNCSPTLFHQTPFLSIPQNEGGQTTADTGNAETSDYENINLALAIGLDFPLFENNSFSLPSFQPLEPQADSDATAQSSQHSDRTPCSEELGDLSKNTEGQDLLMSHPSPGSVESSNSRTSVGDTEKDHLNMSPEGDSGMWNIGLETGSLRSFYQLQPELTCGEESQNAPESAIPTMLSAHSSSHGTPVDNCPTPTENLTAAREQNDQLLDTEQFADGQPVVEILRNQSTSSVMESASFYELNMTEKTVDESLVSELFIEDCMRVRQEDPRCTENLSGVNTNQVACAQVEGPSLTTGTTDQPEKTKGNVDMVSLDHSSLHSEQDLLPPSKKPAVAIVDGSGRTSDSEVAHIASLCENAGTLNSNPACAKMPGTNVLQNIPIWDMQSGRGIMEEPELTLISLNDSCITVPDLELGNPEENSEVKIFDLPHFTEDSELKSCTWMNNFETLHQEECDSILSLSNSCPQDVNNSDKDLASLHKFEVMQLDSTSCKSSLQEAFLRRKKDFIQQSSRRLKELKTKERQSTKTIPTAVPKKESTLLPLQMEHSSCSERLQGDLQLKKVAEVKVCTPEARKMAEVQMHQRTLRLYNQLDEVKIKMTEKMRQESYAKNRGKAKDFHKKTLEKLRSKKVP